MTTLARKNDLATSHEAATKLKNSGKHAHQKTVVFGALCRCRMSATSAELARDHGLDRYLVARRLPDLEKDGRVEKEGKRQCRVTGKKGVVWRVKR